MKQKVAYARVSTREQAENQYALEQQISRLKEIPDIEILFDVGTGADPNRKNFANSNLKCNSV